MEHGAERNRQTVTDHSAPVDLENIKTGEKFSMSMSSHTYTQSERYCRNCGWVTCKGILGALICSECNEQWS